MIIFEDDKFNYNEDELRKTVDSVIELINRKIKKYKNEEDDDICFIRQEMNEKYQVRIMFDFLWYLVIKGIFRPTTKYEGELKSGYYQLTERSIKLLKDDKLIVTIKEISDEYCIELK